MAEDFLEYIDELHKAYRMKNKIKIVVMNINTKDGIKRVLQNEDIGTIVS